MLMRDNRYDLIKPMIDSGNIVTFNDIFKYIPKTIVAKDLGKKVDRFTELMKRVDGFTGKELFRLAKLIDIDESEILRLMLTEYLNAKNKVVKL